MEKPLAMWSNKLLTGARTNAQKKWIKHESGYLKCLSVDVGEGVVIYSDSIIMSVFILVFYSFQFDQGLSCLVFVCFCKAVCICGYLY